MEVGVWSVVEGDGAFFGCMRRRFFASMLIKAVPHVLWRPSSPWGNRLGRWKRWAWAPEGVRLGAGRDGSGRLKEMRGDARGSASALEEMGLDAKGVPPALWRRWEWTLGEVHLGAGGSRLGATGGLPWSWRRWDWIFGESASGRLGRCCGRVCIWIKRTASHGSRFNGH